MSDNVRAALLPFCRGPAGAGLPVLRFHDLRHSFGTQAIRAFNIYEVQRMIGHRSITTTERYLQLVCGTFT